MSIFTKDTFDQINDAYIERYGQIKMATNITCMSVYLNGKTYYNQFDFCFWKAYHRAEFYIKLGIKDLRPRSRSASHIKICKHVTERHIREMKQMFYNHVTSKVPTLVYRGDLLMHYKDGREEMDIISAFVLPLSRYICDIWPLCKFPIVPRYIDYD